MNDKPFYITFYSYRGGADRLTALVNVGVELAQRGRKVLVVDFDVEAPGLTALAPLRPDEPRPGLVEYVAEYLDTNRAPPVAEYLYRTPVGKKDGELWVMPAGKEDADYWAALARINWQELYDLHAGFLFFEDMRLQWQQKVKLGQQEVKFDYVLINSPGGINDLTGICTRQLPDLVMLLAAPDGTDRAGLQLACEEIRAEGEENAPRDIALALVLTGVSDSPDDDRRAQKVRADDFAGALRLERVGALIHRDDRLAPQGRPVVQARPRGRAAREYRRLARLCLKANSDNDRDGALLYLKEIRNSDPLSVIDAGLSDRFNPAKRLERILDKFIRDEKIVFMGAECLQLARRYGNAITALGDALAVQPESAEIRLRRAEYLVQSGRTAEAVKELYQVLDKLGVAENHVVQAMIQLCALLSPEEYEKAREKSAVQKLSEAQRVVLVSLEALERLCRATSDEPTVPDELRLFLDGRRWKEMIARLEHRVKEGSDFTPREAFFLAIADWGATGRLCKDLCQRGIDAMHRRPRAPNDFKDLWDAQLLSVMFWGAGNRDKARQFLTKTYDWARRIDERKPRGTEFLFRSFWRNRDVSFDQLGEDFRELGRMIKGEAKIRPPFLEEEHAA